MNTDQSSESRDYYWLSQALMLARTAAQQNEVPVGALIIDEETQALLATGYNMPIYTCDPTAHAEVVALRRAALRRQNYRLIRTTLYVTLEPCAMCVGAILQARINRVVFGAYDLRAGAISSVFQLLAAPQLNHRMTWQGGLLADQCAQVLQHFFRQRRLKPQQNKPKRVSAYTARKAMGCSEPESKQPGS